MKVARGMRIEVKETGDIWGRQDMIKHDFLPKHMNGFLAACKTLGILGKYLGSARDDCSSTNSRLLMKKRSHHYLLILTFGLW